MSKIQNALMGAIALTLLHGTMNTMIAHADDSVPPGINPELAGTSINQQADIIQNSGIGNNILRTPTCAGTCIFAITHMNNRNSIEAVAGVVWQLSSPQTTLANLQSDRAKVQNEKLIQESNTALAEKLADAIEEGKEERANLLAIILAKRLGYSDPQQLLRDAKTIDKSLTFVK